MSDINGYKISTSEVRLYALSMAITLLTKYGLVEEAKDEIYTIIFNYLTRKPGSAINSKEKMEMEKEFIEFMESKS